MAYKKLKYWFDTTLAERLAEAITPLAPDFPAACFVSNIDHGLEDLELKARIELMADELHAAFGGDYQSAVSILLEILGPENDQETGMFTHYYWIMPVAKYVEKYGLQDFDLSMRAIVEITKRNTGEYAIRPFLVQYPAETLAVMLSWSNDENFHVRRLSSEGGRPRLPWARQLPAFIADPTPLLPILDNLKDDPYKYVQKSVANCLNDILKDNPAIAQALIEQWRENPTAARRWIIKHALRNKLKIGDAWAVRAVQ